jgi:hypothetical protein
MRKLSVLLMAIVFLAGCATVDPRVTALEEKVVKLERKLVMGQATGAGANIYPVTGALTGGGTGALDKITSTADKDAAIAMFNAEGTYGNAFMPFTLDEAGGCGTEAAPYCIESGDAGEYWELTDGWFMTMYGKIPVVVDAAASAVTITAAQARSGTLFINTLAGTKQYVLPPAEAGMSVCFRNGQGNARILQVDTDGTDYIVLNSTGVRTTGAGDIYAATASAKNQICLAAFDATDWYVISEIGTWAEE